MPANPEKLKSIKEFSHKNIFFAVARNSAGRTFVGTSDFKVYEVDISAAKPELKEIGGHESYVTSLALAGNSVVSGGYDGQLIWWDADAKKPIRKVAAHARWIRDVRVSPDGKWVASVADDMVARIWDAATGKKIHELRGHKELTPHHFQSMLYACTFSPDNKHLATVDKVGQIFVWDIATGAQAAKLEAPVMYTWDPTQRRHSIGGIRSVAFSTDGKLLAVGGMGKVGNIDHLEGKTRVEVFDWKAGKRECEFPGDKFNGLVNQLAFDPSGNWLLAAGGANDGFLMFLDLKTKKPLRQEKVAMHIHDIAVNSAVDSILAAGHGRLIQYDLKG
jgi:WD40 repeat protein